MNDKRKLEPPLKLDMGFDEAFERFVRTDSNDAPPDKARLQKARKQLLYSTPPIGTLINIT